MAVRGEKWEYKRALETVRLTKEAMAKENPAFNIKDLSRVEITVGASRKSTIFVSKAIKTESLGYK